MTRDEFEAKLQELTDSVYARLAALPKESEERAMWSRVFMLLNQAQREVAE